MSFNPLLKLKHEPAFDIDKDLEQIKTLPPADGKEPPFKNTGDRAKSNVIPRPDLRAYVLTKGFEPVAIFDKLSYDGFETFVRLVLCMAPQHLDNPEGFHQIDVMNIYKKGLRRRWIKRPFKLAFFVADKIWYHLSIPIDLMIYLCVRYRDFDIVERDFWDIITEGDNPHV